MRLGVVLYGFPSIPVRPVRLGAVWYGYTNGYTTNLSLTAGWWNLSAPQPALLAQADPTVSYGRNNTVTETLDVGVHCW